MATSKRATLRPLANVRASVTRMQVQGEKMVAQFLKEFRQLERRVVKGLHAATEEQVSRLERRVAKLEEMIAALRKPANDQAA
jgi:hypothetical protein